MSPRRGLSLLVVMLLVAGVAYGVHLGLAIAPIAAGYAARQTCSCLFVSGRSPPSCQGDLTGALALVTTWRVDGEAVTAGVLGGFPARAEFEEGYGCHVVR